MRLLTLLCLAAFALPAEPTTQELILTLAQQAAAFEKIAPGLIGREELHQRALTPPARHKIRVGKEAEKAPQPTWKERTLVSRYGFAIVGEHEIHEIRQVLSVNGRKVSDDAKAQRTLALLARASDDERKRRGIEQLEKYGLRGGVTDFGQLLLLFGTGNVGHYEFTYGGIRMQGKVRTNMFRYKQLDGPRALTIYREDRANQTRHVAVQGEIWLRESDGVPVRITMNATDEGAGQTLREEAVVDYEPSAFGTLLAVRTQHKEFRAGQLVAENQFTYSGFEPVGAALGPGTSERPEVSERNGSAEGAAATAGASR
jgi:hypothetical protein